MFGFGDGGPHLFDDIAAGGFFEGGGHAGGQSSVFLAKGVEGGGPCVQCLEWIHRVLEDEKPAFEVEFGDHAQHDVGV